MKKFLLILALLALPAMASAGTVDDEANADIAVDGTVSGDYTDTQASDDTYESIQEKESGGNPNNRYSFLEHKWTISVIGGETVTFYVEAYHTSNSENDDFIFAYSTDDSSYTNMVTVTKTSDDDTYQSYALPGSTSGTVYIRVLDTDQTAGNKTLDTIYVDDMYIRSTGVQAPVASVSFANAGQYKMLYDARQRPPAVYLDGKVHIVWNGNCTPNSGEVPSEPMAITYNPVSREFSDIVALAPGDDSKDHHKAPVIWPDSNDYLHVLYECHSSSGTHLIADNPGTIGTSDSDWSQGPQIAPTMSYPTVFNYDNGSKQVIYYRTLGHDSGWTYRTSDDDGQTWVAPTNDVVDLNSTGKLEWGSYHSKQMSNNGNYMHVAFTEYDDNKIGDPDRFWNPRYNTSINWKYNIFYIKINLDTDEVKNYAGTTVTTTIDYNEAHDYCMIYDTNWAGTETIPSIAIDLNDEPHFLHVYSEDTTTEYGYYYIRNVDSTWVSTRITTANHERNSPYLSIDDDGTLHAYLVVGDLVNLGSMDNHGGGDIEEWISTDDGYTWNIHLDLTPDRSQYPDWLYSNPQPVTEPNGTAVDGMLLFYGWLDPEDREAEAFLIHGTSLFTDGFEDCFTNWITTGSCSDTSYTGAKSLEMDNSEYAVTSVSTAGYSGLTVRYVVNTSDMSSGDEFISEWHDGSSWNEIESITSGFTTWTAKEFELPAGADDNADFELQFRVINSTGNFAYVDAVEILYEYYDDTVSPTPDPMTWATEPNETGGSSIAMVATTASDSSGVEYYFANLTDPNHDSGWQTGTSYQDTGLTPSTEYTYKVKARDLSSNHNETAYSTTASATTTSETTNTIFADGFEACFTNWTNGGAFCSATSYEGAQSAKFDNTEYIYTNQSTAGYTDITVKYVLKCNGMESGDTFVSEWYDGSSWNEIESVTSGFADWTAKEFGLPAGAGNNADFQLQFRVDNVATNFAFVDNVELIGSSGGTPDTNSPTPDPATWASAPSADSSSAISMTATTGSDATGPVQYYFDETTGNSGADDSGWVTDPAYTDSDLDADTTYTYTVQMRDSVSPTPNVGTASSPANATTDAGCTPTDMHVSSIVCTTVAVGGGNKIGRATVTILDDCGNPLQNADVDGTFTGDFDESVINITTNASGVAVLETVGTAKGGISFTFCVDDVTHATLTYDDNDNVETCDTN